MRSWFLLVMSVFLVEAPARADESALAAAHEQLTEMDRAEQEAFVEGNCEELLDLLADDISFYMTGRKVTKEAVGSFCERIPRPFPETGEKQTRIEAVSPDAGYVVRTMTFPGTPRVEVVTKIWRKRADGWKMVHFQSTVTDLKPPGQP